MSPPKIEFLTRSSCQNSPTLAAELNIAFEQLTWDVVPVMVDLDQLKKDDPLTGYGSPTILVGGLDLFGMPRPGPSAPT